MSKRRFTVILSVFHGCHRYVDHVVATRRTLDGAMRAVEQTANKHSAKLQWTRALPQTKAEVIVERDGKTVYSHPGFRVPSVGELGYW